MSKAADPDVELFHQLTDMIGRLQGLVAQVSELRTEALERLYLRPGASLSSVAATVEISVSRVHSLLKGRGHGQ